MVIDWTQIVVAVIATVGAICAGLITKQLVPWLKDKNLYEAAVIAVHSAEAIFGRYHGEEKLAAAIEYMKDRGFNVETERVMKALEAAWKDLDISMIMVGAKEAKE